VLVAVFVVVDVPVCVLDGVAVPVLVAVLALVGLAVDVDVFDAVLDPVEVLVGVGVMDEVGDAIMHTSTLSTNSVLSPRLSATLRMLKTRSCGAPAGTNTETRVNWPVLLADDM
jgi:hypothetical protein